MNFGESMEFKNDCDGFFGKMDTALNSAQHVRDILTPKDVVEVMSEYSQREQDLFKDSGCKPPPDWDYIEFSKG